MISPQTLNIALSDCLAYLRLSEPLAEQQRRNPGIHIRLRERNLAQLHHGLSTGEFNVGLCQSPRAPVGIEASPLWREPLVLAASENHPLMADQAASLNPLPPFTWVTLDREAYAGYRDQVDPLLRSGGNARPSSIITAQSFDLMMTMVAAGYGVCLAPMSHVRRYRAFGIAWRQIEDPPMTLTTYLWHRKDAGNDMLNKLVDALLATS